MHFSIIKTTVFVVKFTCERLAKWGNLNRECYKLRQADYI